jgi:hypothetical protein
MYSPSAHTFSVDIHESGQIIWDKSEVVLLGSSKGTTWEHFENLIVTLWEHIWKEAKNNPKKSLTPPPKEKNWTPNDCMLSLLIGCMKVLFPKLFVPIFDLG